MPEAGRRDGGLRSEGVGRGRRFFIEFDGRPIVAHEGESVLAALWAAGERVLRVTARTKEPRGFYCAMGACFECLVAIDGTPGLRACVEPARPGMRVETHRDAGDFAAAARSGHDGQ